MLRRCMMRFGGAAAAGGSAAKGPWCDKTDDEIIDAVQAKKIPFYAIEDALKPELERAISIRREVVRRYIRPLPEGATKEHALTHVPFKHYDWQRVVGQSCENIVGYVPVPVGLAGPILIDGVEYPLPMATTEGALIASTHRGARAITMCGGVKTILVGEGMTRAPVVGLPSLEDAAALQAFCRQNFHVIKAAFESTTRFGKLLELKVAVTGRKAYLRFRAFTGDAMGMNMVTKGVDKALEVIKEHFPALEVLALSGNYCTDKKPSAINWVEGRGKSIVAEATVKADVVEKMLKTSVDRLIQLNIDKNYIGSAMAGSLGGFNAQAANVVAAMFLATGQDPAQVVESSTCLTSMSRTDAGDLLISVTMPSIEVGTVGGGTGLAAQHAMLELIGCAGANHAAPGANSQLLARVIASGVLSAELSLMSGLVAGHLLSAHMKLNRKQN